MQRLYIVMCNVSTKTGLLLNQADVDVAENLVEDDFQVAAAGREISLAVAQPGDFFQIIAVNAKAQPDGVNCYTRVSGLLRQIQ